MNTAFSHTELLRDLYSSIACPQSKDKLNLLHSQILGKITVSITTYVDITTQKDDENLTLYKKISTWSIQYAQIINITKRNEKEHHV